MSFESGRKLGFTASLINVFLPVLAVIAYVILIVSIFASIPTTRTPSVPSFTSTFVGMIGFFIALGVIAFIGLILFLLAMYRLSHYYSEPGIFNNVLYAVIISIVGGIGILVIYFAFIASSIGSLAQTSTPSNIAPFITQFIVSLLLVGVVAVILGIASAVLHMRAFNKLAEKSGVDSFKTAGLLYLIGTLLSFLGVGAIIVWIAWIFAAMGFHRLQPTLTTTTTYATQPQPTFTGQTKRCTYCGAENSPDALYCRVCGKPL